MMRGQEQNSIKQEKDIRETRRYQGDVGLELDKERVREAGGVRKPNGMRSRLMGANKRDSERV